MSVLAPEPSKPYSNQIDVNIYSSIRAVAVEATQRGVDLDGISVTEQILVNPLILEFRLCGGGRGGGR